MKRTRITLAALALVAFVAALTYWTLTLVLEPSPADRFWTAYTELYPGTPATERADFVAKAEQVCQAGAPTSWWAAWDNGNPARRDLWNLTITHLCPEHEAHRVPVTHPDETLITTTKEPRPTRERRSGRVQTT